jgi:hypothetical protein
MATRSIVTSHPEVACDVCGRRLLRGEQPDVFLSGGQRRMVCELCVPRAAHGGWLRESDENSASRTPVDRLRRSRSLLGRLRQPVTATQKPLAADKPIAAAISRDPRSIALTTDLQQGLGLEEDVLQAQPDHEEAEPQGELQQALAIFNTSEHPRRVAGVTRSLGAPSVNVAPVAPSSSQMDVVVAWELCWYRYQVDLDDERAGTQLLTQGTELDELPQADRVANAAADERGELSLIA